MMNDIENERIYAAALVSIPGLGSASIRNLITVYGSAAAVWEADSSEWIQHIRLSDKKSPAMETYKKTYDWDYAVFALERHAIQIRLFTEETYPAYLRQTFNPPAVLFYQGEVGVQDQTIAIVGARKATAYGCNAARSLGADMARNGIVVVSGGARGIDTQAHRGALLAQGRTLAVVANGLDISYPPENKRLFQEIRAGGGAVVTEFPLGTRPLPQHFPARNRIIAGLSRGVAVIEAALKSGSLITADFALEEGRDVFAVPGSIFSDRSKGTNNLLRKGAIVLTGVQDVLDEYQWGGPMKKKEKSMIPLTLDEAAILSHIPKDEAISAEKIISRSGTAAAVVNSIVLQLQLKGIVEDRGNSMYVQKG
jgi:DNA processing protein